MIISSKEFKKYAKEPIKLEESYYIEFHNNEIYKDDEKLKELKITASSNIIGTSMKKVEFNLIGNYQKLNEKVKVFLGNMVGNKYEYILLGEFKITELTYNKDEDTTKFIGYDLMIDTMKQYKEISSIIYPLTLLEYLKKICEELNIELENESIVNGDIIVDNDFFANTLATYRDIIEDIAKHSFSIAIINNKNKLELKNIKSKECETLNLSNFMNYKFMDEFKPVNSLVLSRTPQEDNVYFKDDVDINKNGLNEFKMSNLQIVDRKRERVIQKMFNNIKGFTYYPVELKTEGLGYYEIGDVLLLDLEGKEYITIVSELTLKLKNGIEEEILKSSNISNTATKYQYATSIEKKLINTEIVVDKALGQITEEVAKVTEKANELTKFQADIEGLKLWKEAQIDLADHRKGIGTITTKEAEDFNIVKYQAKGGTVYRYIEGLYPSEELFPSATLFMPEKTGLEEIE